MSNAGEIIKEIKQLVFSKKEKVEEEEKVEVQEELEEETKEEELENKTEEDVEEETFETATLEDGTVITYGTWEVGAAVTVDGEALADGEYVLDNGDRFVIAEGVIAEIIPLVEDEEEPLEDDKIGKVMDLIDELSDKITKLEKMNKDQKKVIDEIVRINNDPEVDTVTKEKQEITNMSEKDRRMAVLREISKINKKNK